jgi:hypothetical protein
MGNLLSLGRLVGLVAKFRHDRKSPGLAGALKWALEGL